MVTVDLGGSGVTAKALALGEAHSCALLNDSTVKCWGRDDEGQRGGVSGKPYLGASRTAFALASGKHHVCAALDNGELFCWGDNTYGQTGGGRLSFSPEVQFVSLGYEHSCALLRDGTVQCWGRNTRSQKDGDNTKANDTTLTTVDLGQDFLGQNHIAMALGLGWNHSCAILRDKSLKCWGSSTTDQSRVPAYRTACVIGEVKDATTGQCRVPGENKYADLSGTEQSCNTQSQNLIANVLKLGGQATPFVASDTECPFICSQGYLKREEDRTCVLPDSCPNGYVRDTSQNEPLCRTPRWGYYADASGGELTCAAISHSQSLGGRAVAVSSENSCAFTCEKGYVKNAANRSCDVPSDGHYADASGLTAVCSEVPNAESLGGFALPVAGEDACPFTCPDGYIKNESTRSCCPPGSEQSGGACRQIRTVVDLGGGADHSCMVLDDGSVRCWGANDEWQKDGTGTSTTNTDLAILDLGQKALAVESGEKHTCAILEDRSVQCWGRNDEGQTTNPTNGGKGIVAVYLGLDNVSTPLRALGLDLGKNHTCVIVDDGDGDALGPVKCWGANDEEQKDGTSTHNGSMVTVQVGSSDVLARALALGQAHSCAIKGDGSVVCWGRDDEGQTGTSGVPALGADRTATAIAAGKNHTCALLDDDSVKCWGDDSSGQVAGGTPSLGSSSLSSKAKAISLGYDHSCALLVSGAVQCWGSNVSEQKDGDSTATSDTTLVTVDLGQNALGQDRRARALGLGWNHSCAVLSDKSLKCWGSSATAQSTVPAYRTACAIGEVLDDTTGECRVPGANKYADLLGAEQDCNTTLPPANSISLGGEALPFVADADSCPFLCRSGHLRKEEGSSGSPRGCVLPANCPVGYVRDDLLGTCRAPRFGNYADASGVEHTCNAIANAVTLGGDGTQPYTAVSDGACNFTCSADSVKSEGLRICCPSSRLVVEDADGTGTCQDKKTIVDLAVGIDHNCIVLEDGSVRCWGYNGSAEADSGYKDGGTTTHNVTDMAVVDLGGKKALEVEAGRRHTCAILEDKTVMCWGRNDEGQTTNPQSGDQGAVAVDLGTDGQGLPLRALALSLGYRHSCAIVDEGYNDGLGLVKCWGVNDDEQKDGDSANTGNTDMVTVNLGSASTRAKALALGDKHTCAILDDDTVKCWGNNALGQTQGGTPQLWDDVPLTIAAGENHTCIIRDIADSTVRCWGENKKSKVLGTGNTDRKRIGYVSLGSGRKASKVALGSDHTCTLLDDGSVKCWGSNALLQSNPDGGTSDTAVAAIDLGTNRTAIMIGAGWRHTCAVLDSNEVKCWGFRDNQRTASSSSMRLCPLGMVNDSVIKGCRAPRENKYADSQGIEQDCDDSKAIADSLTLGGQAEGFVTASTCPFTCQSSYLANSDNRTCVPPDDCPTGYVRDTTQWLCRPPAPGLYADASGAERTCSPVIAHSATFGGEATVVADAGSCAFTCQQGYSKNAQGGRSCDGAPAGSYFDVSGTTKTCDPIPGGSATLGGKGGFLRQVADKCAFTCPAGGVRDEVHRSCCPLGQIKRGSACGPVRTVKDIGLGADHSCVVLDDGSVQCWGSNAEQQKDGTSTNNTDRVRVALGQKALEVESGHRHACALLEDKSMKCWGRNDEGQTSNSSTSDKSIVAVDLGRNRFGKPFEVLAMDLGKNHTCAIVDDADGDALGPVKCWGANDEEQKDGTSTNNGNMVTVQVGGSDVLARALALGQAHSCAIKGDGSVVCWGRDDEGQTGTSGVPALGAGHTAVAIAAGRHHTCALLEDSDPSTTSGDGAVKCWGDNTHNQRGGGDPLSAGSSGATALSLGYDHSCALIKNGEMKCWGRNTDSRSDGDAATTTANYPSPVLVSLGQDALGQNRTATMMGLGWGNSCAVLSDKTLKCWGSENHAQTTVPAYADLCAMGEVLVSASTKECRAPETGKYADSGGVERSCTGSIVHSAILGGQTLPFLTDSTCPYTCNLNFWKKLDDRTCVISCPTGYIQKTETKECLVPLLGKYADSGGVERSCAGSISDSATLGGQVVSVESDTACPFTCPSGYLRNDITRTCSANANDVASKVNDCESGYKEKGDLCEPTSCPKGFYKEGNVCVTVDHGWVSGDGDDSLVQELCYRRDEYPNKGRKRCISCAQVGHYLHEGLCKEVPEGFVSPANSLTATECTSDEHPNTDKSACELNRRSCKTSNHQTGEQAWDSQSGDDGAYGACTELTSGGGCYKGYHDSGGSGSCTAVTGNDVSPASDNSKTTCSSSTPYPNADKTACVDCSQAGYYVNTDNVCQKVAEPSNVPAPKKGSYKGKGYYSPAGDLTQTECPWIKGQSPTYPNVDKSACTKCRAPGYFVFAGVCRPVEDGYASQGTTSQTFCGSDKYPTEHKDRCVPCTRSGYYVENGLCKEVPKGSISVANSNAISQCTGGEVPNDTRDACVDCSALSGDGFSVDSDLGLCRKEGLACDSPITNGRGLKLWGGYSKTYSPRCSLLSCSAGHYQKPRGEDDRLGPDECVPVPTGYVSAEGSTLHEQCGVGEHPNTDNTACEPDTRVCKTTDHKVGAEVWKAKRFVYRNCTVTKADKCYGGYYLNGGSCEPVDTNHISLIGSDDQTDCTYNGSRNDLHPNAEKTRCDPNRLACADAQW